MKDLPFSVYDFFGYLASGFVLLFVGGYALDYSWYVAREVSSLPLMLWIVTAYVTGHVVAHLAGAVLETTIMRRHIGRSEVSFFCSPIGWRRRFFSGFLRPLPVETIVAVFRHAEMVPGDGLFFHCWAAAKHDDVTFGRMNTFLNLYGFARNMCMAALLGVIALAVGAMKPFLAGGTPSYTKQWLIVPLLVVALVMFYRYLKFYRLYSNEVYVTFAGIAR